MSSALLFRVTILLVVVVVVSSQAVLEERFVNMYRGPVIDCTEVSGYLAKLKQFFDEECEKIEDGCPWKVRKAIKWYGRVSKQLKTMCN